MLFYGLRGKRADVSPDGKQLQTHTDTRNTKCFISTLPTFVGWVEGGERGWRMGLRYCQSVKRSACTLSHRFWKWYLILYSALLDSGYLSTAELRCPSRSVNYPGFIFVDRLICICNIFTEGINR